MPLTPSILAAELAFGPVERITVPPEYVDALTAELSTAERLDLVPLIVTGAPGWLVVTIAGRDWPYGGL